MAVRSRRAGVRMLPPGSSTCSPPPASRRETSKAPARYVLELNAGEAARLGLYGGIALRLAPALQDAP